MSAKAALLELIGEVRKIRQRALDSKDRPYAYHPVGAQNMPPPDIAMAMIKDQKMLVQAILYELLLAITKAEDQIK
jgi:hypothetical protein